MELSVFLLMLRAQAGILIATACLWLAMEARGEMRRWRTRRLPG